MGATDWYCEPEHTVSVEHARSENAVGGVDWNCDPLHVVKAAHWRFDFAVGATV